MGVRLPVVIILLSERERERDQRESRAPEREREKEIGMKVTDVLCNHCANRKKSGLV